MCKMSKSSTVTLQLNSLKCSFAAVADMASPLALFTDDMRTEA